MDNIFVDTSFKSKYYYYSKAEGSQKVKENFSRVIASIETSCPGFEADYYPIENAYSFIEYIGLGKLYKNLIQDEDFEKCFEYNKDLGGVLQSGDVEEINRCFNGIFERLYSFFYLKMMPQNLIIKAQEKLKKYKCHEFALYQERIIRERVSSLQKESKDSNEFKTLCALLSWDALFRSDWNWLQENKILLFSLLGGYYLSSLKVANLPGTILFEKLLGKCIVRFNEELLDAYLLDALCMGLLNQGKREPIKVVTADKYLESQVKMHLKGAIFFKKHADRLEEKDMEFIPGKLIVVDRESPAKESRIIKISQLIKDLSSE